MAEEPFPFEAENESSSALLESCTTSTTTNSDYTYYDVGLGSVGIGMVVTAGIFKYLVETALRSNFDNTWTSFFLYSFGASWLPFLVFSLGVGLLAICLARVKLHYSPTSDTDAVIGAVAVLCLGVAGPKIGFSDESITTASKSNTADMDRSSRFYSLISSWVPLLVHSVGVGLLAYCFAQWRARSSSNSIAPASKNDDRNPNTITRLRSHLTFLPIIQLIRQRAATQGICEPIEDSSTNTNAAVPGRKSVDKGVLSKLQVQRDSFADAIVQNCILPWYEQISEDKVFPSRAKFVIVHFCEQLSKKIRKIDRAQLSKEAIEVVHFHWANYCEATKEVPNKDFRYVHDFIGDREAMVKHLEALTTLLIKDSIVPELQSPIVCQFLAAVLTKAVILYYIDLVTNPQWINMTVKNLVSSRILTEVNSLSHGSSQESLSDTSSVKHEEDSISIKPVQLDVTEACVSAEVAETESVVEETETSVVTPDSSNGEAKAEPEMSDSSPEDVNRPLNLFVGVPLVGDGKQDVTVSAALGGLLSTTALTLLPEGYAYAAAAVSKSGNVSPCFLGLLEDEISMDKLAAETERLVGDSLGDSQEDDEAVGKNNGGGVTRHFSLEGVKSRNAVLDAEKVYQSLDETKSVSLAAEEEREKNSDLTLLTTGSNEEREKLQQISPMYDEAEDFAATIAKLRSLLEQRESQKNLLKNDTAIPNTEAEAEVFAQSQKEVTESDPRQITKQSSTPNSRSSVSTNRPSLNSQGSASSLGSEISSASLLSHNSWDGDKLEKIEDVLEEGGPVINRFFLNVAIPKTENCSDSSGQFVLYSIQYEGVYPEENDEGVLEKLVMRTTTIKRRFQEFLLLQSQMEESTIWKPHLKGIKAPTKWFSLSFAKSDTSNINQRKVILERYLQQLCYHPVLGFCPLLRQFMAYGEEGFQAFTSSDEIPIHRFNKFTKKFTGVFNSLREVLPSFEMDLLATPATNNPDADPRSPAEIKARSLLALFLREERIAEHDETSDSVDDPLETKIEEVEEAIAAEPNSTSEGEGIATEPKAEEDPVDVGQIKEAYPLAVAMTNLLCDVLWLPPHRPHSASISTFLSISGRSFESYLEESLDVLVCQEAWVGYLETLGTSVKAWGQEEDGKELPSPESEQVTEAELKQVLQGKIPVWIRWMWGRSRVDMTIDRLTKVCQDAKINQDLVLSLVELVFSKLIGSVEREVAKSE